MKKKIFMFSSLAAGIIAVASSVLAGINPLFPHGTKAGNESYGITFDSTKNKLHDHPGATSYDGDAMVKTDCGSDISFSYYHVMGWRNTWHVFGGGGYFYNIDPIHGMESISLTFNSADVPYSIYYSGDNSLDKSKSFVSKTGSTVSFDFDGYQPNYFKLVNTDGSANLNIASVRISLSCANTHPTITLESDGKEMGTVGGGGEKEPESNVTITATPNNGYRFVGWYDGGKLISTDSSYSFVIGNSDLSYSARFTYKTYDLVIASEDGAKGVVSDSSGSYNYLDRVSISATPNKGYSFEGWYTGLTFVSKNNPYEFTMPYSDLNYVARFSTNEYVLSLENENEDLGSIGGTGTFEYGSNVTITAAPSKGASFLGWYDSGGKLVSSDPVHSFLMPYEDVSYSARFAWTPYSVLVSVNDDSMGSVTGSGSYTYGQEVTLVATPNEHHSFFGWYDGDSLLSQDASYSFSMPDNSLDYIAKFVKNYKISVSSDNESMGTVSAPEEWGEGLEVTIRADAKKGYAIDYWCDVNMNKVSEDFNYTFQMPSHDIELYAVFTKGYGFLLKNNDPETGTISDASGRYKAGSMVTVEATCRPGFFKGWYDESGKLVSPLNPYSFSMPSNDYSLVGNFVSELEVKHATFPILSDDGKTIKYGLCPQTIVDDSSLVSSLNSLTKQDANGWYFYNDDYYAKATAKPFNSSYVFSNGATIEKGKDYWFRCKPIEWKVLNNANGEYFVVSDLVLDASCYYKSYSNRTIDGKTIYPSNYEYSDIRTWLNKDFYGSAFALGNKNIMTTTVENSAYSTGYSSNKYACEDTDDKVFLLSYTEATNSKYGFSRDNDRIAYATDYAKCKGICVDQDNTSSSWWLRSPSCHSSDEARYFYDDGSASYGAVVASTGLGVRPALRINLF